VMFLDTKPAAHKDKSRDRYLFLVANWKK
jgi:hypothetical protein